MPDKSFEQAVSAELEGLRIKPDAKVWEVVAASLKRKKKRRVLVWLLLLGVSVGGAAFWLYQNPTGSIAPAKIHQPASVLQITGQQITDRKSMASTLQKNSRQNHTVPVHAIPVVIPPGEVVEIKKLNSETAFLPKKKSAEISRDSLTSFPVADKTAMELVSEILTPDSVVVTPEMVQNDPIPKHEQAIPNRTTTFPASKKKWQWTLLVEAGAGGFRNALVGLNKSASYRFQPLSNNAPPLPGTGTQYNAQRDAAGTRDAFSWGIQVLARKPFGKKSSMGLSAGYGLYRTKTGSNELVNQVHLLETGVELSRDFLLFKTLSLRTRLGTGLDLLIASQGFRLPDSTGTLGPKPSLTRLQPHLSAGFDLALGKQPIVYIGPQFKYHIRGLYTLYGEPQHLVLAALRVTMPLQKIRKNK